MSNSTLTKHCPLCPNGGVDLTPSQSELHFIEHVSNSTQNEPIINGEWGSPAPYKVNRWVKKDSTQNKPYPGKFIPVDHVPDARKMIDRALQEDWEKRYADMLKEFKRQTKIDMVADVLVMKSFISKEISYANQDGFDEGYGKGGMEGLKEGRADARKEVKESNINLLTKELRWCQSDVAKGVFGMTIEQKQWFMNGLIQAITMLHRPKTKADWERIEATLREEEGK